MATLSRADRKRMVREIVEGANELDRLHGGSGGFVGDFSAMSDAELAVVHAGCAREVACTRAEVALQVDIEAYASSGKQDPAAEAVLWERVHAARAARAQSDAGFEAFQAMKVFGSPTGGDAC